MKFFKPWVLAGLLVASLAMGSAFAQQATPVQQSGSHLDAGTFWIGQSNGATSCNAVSQTAAQDTITIPAVGSNSAYLTALMVQFSTNATGATAVPTISFTGLANAGAAPFLSAATTLSTTGYHADMVINFPVGGLKGLPGTAITVVPSATMSANSILCMSAVGYYAP